MNSENYYTIPINTKHFFSRSEHETCDLKQSIAHYIHLINTTHFGECSFDPNFGCEIWELDFDNLKTSNKLKSLLLSSLKKSLTTYVKRLTNITVDVKIKQEEIFSDSVSNRIKKRVDLTIRGKVKKTSESFVYNEYFYIGPLSY